MRTLLACTPLLLLPLAAVANDAPCQFTGNRDLQLQLAGAKTVVFEVNQHDLRLQTGSGAPSLSGRACASKAEWLPELTVSQRREGDKLVVSLRREDSNTRLTGQDYAWLDIRGSVPDNVMVQLKVGSGDARIEGARSLSVDVGSGDVDALRTTGSVHAKIGSGDLVVDGAGSLELLSVGSGEARASNVRGDIHIGSVGSGEVELRDVGGSLRIDTIGSADTEVRQVRGNVEIGVVGSGDTGLRDIGGSVRVRSHGSGDIKVEGVGGALTVERSGSGDVRHRDVRGTITLPRGK